MSRFVRALGLAAALVAACAVPAPAQVRIDAPEPRVYEVVAAVVLNGALVSPRSVLYRDEGGTLYAGGADVDAWGLKRPLDAPLRRGGVAYFGLQTQLRLAATFLRDRLTLVAPRSAFVGEPDVVREHVTPGGGASLDYRLDRTVGRYGLFLAHHATTLELGYESRQSSAGMAFTRALTRLYTLDVDHHRVLQLGEANVNAGDVGTAAQYLGVHVASEHRADPLFITRGLPSVRGIAPSASTVEVYVNGVLQWREQVPAGPFVVRDLPANAAYADVTLVLVDASGRRTTETVRPDADPGFLRPGLTSYSLDAGWGRESFTTASPRYRDPVASATVRHGVARWLTLQAMAETMAGNPFAALGFEASPGKEQRIVAWYGEGRIRHGGEVEYELRRGKLDFRERLRYNVESVADPFEPGGAYSRFDESAELRYDPSYELALRLRLDRTLNSTGFPASVLSFEGEYRFRRFTVAVRPTYDAVDHLLGATLELRQRVGETHEFRERLDRPAQRPAGTLLDYDKRSRDDTDPLSYRALLEGGAYDARELAFDVRMPWAEARVLGQEFGDSGNVQTELEGALALVGGGLHASESRYEGRTFGVVRIPGFPAVPIEVNGRPEGETDARGLLVLRRLSALEENRVVADLSRVPLAVGIRTPVVVQPLPAAPVTLDLLEPRAQALLIRVVDANGAPLPPATRLTADDGTRFPIGFNGRAYLHGLTAGRHTFSAPAPAACAFELDFAPRWEIVQEGTLVCAKRPKSRK